jgi:ABC-2 type transport system permease protein
MNTLQLTTSIKRELWEYKKIFQWIPISLAVLLVCSPVIGYLLSDFSSGQWLIRFERISELTNSDGFSQIVFGFISVLFVPFIIISGIVQLYYFMACLFDERRDLSVLFWRSLPVSDAMNIGVKFLVGALILPVIFLLAATATLFVFLIAIFIGSIILSVGYDISLWALWTDSGFVGHLLTSWSSLLPYTLWMFPIYAWLMLVSIFANKAPFLWAILPVVVVLLVESFFVSYFNLNTRFFAETLMDYFVISQNAIDVYTDKHTSITVVPFSVLKEKINVVAILIGAGFMYATYWLRVNKSQS